MKTRNRNSLQCVCIYLYFLNYLKEAIGLQLKTLIILYSNLKAESNHIGKSKTLLTVLCSILLSLALFHYMKG